MALLRKENSSVPRWVREPSGVGLNGCPARCAWGGDRGLRPPIPRGTALQGLSKTEVAASWPSPPPAAASRVPARSPPPWAAPRLAYGQVPATLAPLPALPGDGQGDAVPRALAGAHGVAPVGALVVLPTPAVLPVFLPAVVRPSVVPAMAPVVPALAPVVPALAPAVPALAP